MKALLLALRSYRKAFLTELLEEMADCFLSCLAATDLDRHQALRKLDMLTLFGNPVTGSLLLQAS